MNSRLSIAFILVAFIAAGCGAPSAAPTSTGTPTAALPAEPSIAAPSPTAPQPSGQGLLTYVLLPEESEARFLIGEEYTLRLTGDLTIHGVTRSFTFEARATAEPDGRLVGHASLSFLYPEFGIQIPYLPPQVASVEEQVTLEVDLVFTRQ